MSTMTKHTQHTQTAEFCKDCYLWSDEPKVVKLCRLHAATAGLLRVLNGWETGPSFGFRSFGEWKEARKTVLAAAEGRDANYSEYPFKLTDRQRRSGITFVCPECGREYGDDDLGGTLTECQSDDCPSMEGRGAG